ncbi:MAG: lipopolysaccharide biosynthesis protein [Eggerthellaceae bacterium]|nr:lipopolysaccharide biosynthesis protein [Eggerthellaceae bacterium]
MTLLELLQLMKKHLKLVVALPVICALITAGISWIFLSNTYTATVSVYVLTSKADEQTTQAVTNSDLTAGQLMANDIAKLAKTSNVQKQTAQALGMQNLEGYTVSVESATTTRVIDISVTGKDPAQVAQVANTLASTLSDVAQDVMGVSSVNVVEYAETPDKPSGPKRLMYTGVAFLAGLFLAIAFIVIIDMIDTRVRKPEEAGEILGLPVIGRIPRVKG